MLDALGVGAAPAGVTPNLGLVAQTFDLGVECLDIKFRRQDGIVDNTNPAMYRGLLDLYDRAPGVSEIVVLLIQRRRGRP